LYDRDWKKKNGALVLIFEVLNCPFVSEESSGVLGTFWLGPSWDHLPVQSACTALPYFFFRLFIRVTAHDDPVQQQCDGLTDAHDASPGKTTPTTVKKP
jgi:hypothetical protein